MSKHTRTSIENELIAQSMGWSFLYKIPAINRQGETDGERERMSEVFAGWAADNFVDFAKGIRKYHREKSKSADVNPERPYRVENHHGELQRSSDEKSREKNIAYEMFKISNSEMPNWAIGKVVDYEVPLKESQSDHIGNVDLVSRKGNTLYILELKKPESKETLLRCILEAYTYLRSIGDLNKFKRSFVESDAEVEHVTIKIAPLIFVNSNAHASPWQNLQEDNTQLKKLVRKIERGNIDHGIQGVPVEIMCIDAGDMPENERLAKMDIAKWVISKVKI